MPRSAHPALAVLPPAFLRAWACTARTALHLLPAAVLSGCVSLNTARTETYECEGGRQFALSLNTDRGTRVDIGGMSFPLQLKSANAKGETYGCSVLTLWRDGSDARMQMDGAETFRNCRRLR